MTNLAEHKTRLHLSGDGSHTLFSNTFSQYFHNPNGAIAESRHVFFDTPGLINRIKKGGPFHILEVGFGTGLNLLLLMEYLEEIDHDSKIMFRSIEKHPISLETVAKLNYPELLNLEKGREYLAYIFRQLKPGLNRITLKDQFDLEIYIGDFFEVPPPAAPVNSIFFDPFSPDVNPVLWKKNVFDRLSEWSDQNVILSTYGAASSARAAMAASGWKVARAPGALGKREMTVASLDPDLLNDWTRVNEQRLAERYRGGEF